VFPEAYRDTIIVGNVMTNRINFDRLEWHGSTPRAIEQPDFLWSEDNWFRPVDIELGPDGALYVADFYNRIIGHYEVPLTHPGRDRERGRIWRIVYRGPNAKGQPSAPPNTGPTATRAELVSSLGHPNLAVRTLAANQLAARPPDPSLKTTAVQDESPERRVHALWVLQRWDLLDDDTLETAARDHQALVRIHAMRLLGERAELPEALRELALHCLGDTDALVRRCAAEALGRHPRYANIQPLLGLWHSAPADDTHLIHVVRMALRDQLRDDAAWAELARERWSDRDLRDFADVAVGVPSAAAAQFLLGQIRRVPVPEKQESRLTTLVHHIARYGAAWTEPELTAFVTSQRPEGRTRQAALLKAIQQGLQERGDTPDKVTRKVALEVSRALVDAANPKNLQLGIQLASAYSLRELEDRLTELARDKTVVNASRNAALSALETIAPQAALPVLGQVLGDPSDAMGLREQVAGMLGASSQTEAESILLAALPTAPERLQAAIAAALAARPSGAERLLDSLEAGKGSARVLQEPRVALVLGKTNLPDLKPRLDALLEGLPPADDRLRDLLKRRREQFEISTRDPAEGAKVFEKTCAACHQVRGQGARIGPQLDGIGARGVDRLLEDILDPNRNVDQSFRATNLALTDGRLISGLLLREEGEVLVLADSQGKEVRVPRDTVEERSLAQLSPMPANFADQLPEADFYNLLAYLLAAPPPSPSDDKK
jgi:putative heme-binding domain-containing protein